MLEGWKLDGKILLLHTLTIRGSHVASLVKFHPVVKDVLRSTTDRWKDACLYEKIMLLLHTLFGRGIHVGSLVK